MARTPVPVADLSETGLLIGASGTEVNGDTVNGHEYVNGDNVNLLVRNSDASSHNVTFITAQIVDGLAVADRTVAIAAGAHRAFRVCPANVYDQSGADRGKVFIDVDHATLRLQAIRG